MNNNKKLIDLINDLVSRYLGEENFNEIRNLIANAENSEVKLILKGRKAQTQVEPLEETTKITYYFDNIITYSRKRLKLSQFLSLLIECVELCLTFGEFKIAEYLLNIIDNASIQNQKFDLPYTQSLLLRAELYTRSSQWSSAIQTLRTVKKIVAAKNENKTIGKIHNLLGIIETEKGNLVLASKQYQKALDYFSKVKDNMMVGVVEMNLGIIDTIKSNWDEAYTHYKRALAAFEKLMDLKRLSLVRHNIGMLFKNRGELEAALTEFDRSLEYAMEANYLLAKGLAYLGKGDVYAKLEEYALAMEYCNKAMEVFYKIMDKVGLADTYKIKGVVQRDISNHEIAETYLLTSLRLSEEIESILNYAEASYELGILYRKWQKPDLAKRYLKLSESYFAKVGAKDNLEHVKIIMDRTNNS